MTRPFLNRRVFFEPNVTYFKPAGIPIFQLKQFNLTLDELEAIRLADLQGLYQEDAAKKMKISRQTFGNIIKSAHEKIAHALMEGAALRIEGGPVKMPSGRIFFCFHCHHSWAEAFGTGRPLKCPKCGSNNIRRSIPKGIDRTQRGRRARLGKS